MAIECAVLEEHREGALLEGRGWSTTRFERREQSATVRLRNHHVPGSKTGEQDLAEGADVDDPAVVGQALERRRRSAGVSQLALAVILDHDRPAAVRPAQDIEPSTQAQTAARGVLPARRDEQDVCPFRQPLDAQAAIIDRDRRDGRPGPAEGTADLLTARILHEAQSARTQPGPGDSGKGGRRSRRDGDRIRMTSDPTMDREMVRQTGSKSDIAERSRIGRCRPVRVVRQRPPGSNQESLPVASIECLQPEPFRSEFDRCRSRRLGIRDRRIGDPAIGRREVGRSGDRGRIHGGRTQRRQVARDPGPTPTMDLEIALCDQLVVRRLHGDPGDAQFHGQDACGDQGCPGVEASVDHGRPQTTGELPVERFGDPAPEWCLERVCGPIEVTICGSCHHASHPWSMGAMSSPVARFRLETLVAVLALLAAGCGSVATSPTTSSAVPVAQAPSATVPSGPSPTPRPTASPAPSAPAATDLGDRLVATIDGVVKPCAMAATATDIWVTGNNPSMLARIDPMTDTIVSQAPTNGSPCGIAVGADGRLWIALLSAGQVIAVDPDSGKTTATIKGLGANLWDLKAGFDSIWVVDRTNRELLRIDPRKEKVAKRIAIGPSGSGLAIADGAVWVVDDIDGSVRRIDPATDTVTATIPLARGASWFADDGTTLLVANRLDGSITPIDGATSAAAPSLVGARSPLDGAVVADRAYIPDGKAGTLLEIGVGGDTVASVDRLDGAKNPFVAEGAFGDVWVLDYGGERIWRLHP